MGVRVLGRPLFPVFSSINRGQPLSSQMLKDTVRVGLSGIHGTGIFAERPLKPGDMIIEYAGETIRPCLTVGSRKGFLLWAAHPVVAASCPSTWSSPHF